MSMLTSVFVGHGIVTTTDATNIVVSNLTLEAFLLPKYIIIEELKIDAENWIDETCMTMNDKINQTSSKESDPLKEINVGDKHLSKNQLNR